MEIKVVVNDCSIIGRHQPSSATYPRDIDVFHRIPFAKTARFQSAERIDPSPSSLINATDRGNVSESPLDTISAPESPLHLHIFRPSSNSSSTLRPVVIFFHGGGFNFGHPLMSDLSSFISWCGDDVVAVAVEYRLGALGFAAGEGELNLGLKDQRVGVEWVRTWIGAFGGDGESLTLMGVSAGAHSIGHHMLTPEPMPFQRAIIESGSPTARSVLSAKNPRVQAQQQAFAAPARGNPLGSLPVEQIRSFSLNVWAANMASLTWPFQPVVEIPSAAASTQQVPVIPEMPLELWDRKISEGRGKDVAVLTGFCSHEGIDFAPEGKNTNNEFLLFFKSLIPTLTEDDLKELEQVYPDPEKDDASPYKMNEAEALKKGKQFSRLSDAYGHYAYICPILHTADTLSRAGATVYLYEFAAVSGEQRAASHATHSPTTCHDLSLLGELPGMVEVCSAMTKRWGKFAAGGDLPAEEQEGAKGVWWPKFRGGVAEGEMLVFGEGNDEMAGGGERGKPVRKRKVSERGREVCNFWWKRMGLSQGMGETR